jgi:hypothetical protein
MLVIICIDLVKFEIVTSREVITQKGGPLDVSE